MSARVEPTRARGRVRSGGAVHLLNPSLIAGCYWTLCGWFGRADANLKLTDEDADCKTCLRSHRAAERAASIRAAGCE